MTVSNLAASEVWSQPWHIATMCSAMYWRGLGNDFGALVSKGESGGGRHTARWCIHTHALRYLLLIQLPAQKVKSLNIGVGVWLPANQAVELSEFVCACVNVCICGYRSRLIECHTHTQTQLPPRYCLAENRLLFPGYTAVKKNCVCEHAKDFILSQIKSSRNHQCAWSNWLAFLFILIWVNWDCFRGQASGTHAQLDNRTFSEKNNNNIVQIFFLLATRLLPPPSSFSILKRTSPIKV